MNVGYLPNSFDLMNVRDLDVIAQARQHCSRLIIGVFSDDFIERLFGRRPVVPLSERMTLVSHVRGVDEVVVHSEEMDDVEQGVTFFTVAGDQPFPLVGESWILTPRRETSSIILREALAPVRQADVA